MKKIFLLLISCWLLQDAAAQLLQPSIIWQHTLASRGYRDKFNKVIETPDKSLIAVGNYGIADYDCADFPFVYYDTSHGINPGSTGVPVLHIQNGSRLAVVKYDSSGNQLWKMALGNQHCEGFNIFPDPNGGYIITGYYDWSIYSSAQDTSATSISSQRTSGLWLIKMDDNGHVFWQKIFSGGGGISPTSDGGFLYRPGVDLANYIGNFYGLTSNDNHGLYDGILVKFDANFNAIWSKTYGGSKNDGLSGYYEDEDGNFILTGYTASIDGDLEGSGGIEGENDTWLVKINGSNGNLIWQRKIGASGCKDFGTHLIHTNDNGLLVNIRIDSGYFYHNSQALHTKCIMKLSEQGSFMGKRL